MNFRDATAADIPAMSRIRLAVRENVLRDPSRITRQMYEDYLDLLGHGWVAESNGEVVAFCYADREHASIWALFVDPSHEGRGAAKALLALAAGWLFAQGKASVRLSTGAGTRADRFYEARGWTREAPQDKSDVYYTLLAP